jgi:arabinogalactan endo-1,4-beta-galactosidase
MPPPSRPTAIRLLCGLLLLVGSAPILSAAPLAGYAEIDPPRQEPFIIGADISWIPEDEAGGAEYYDQGERKDVVEIFRDHGFNFVRLRVFVDPASPLGYSRRRSAAFNDTAHTVAMARRVKDAGMGLFLTFHYCDSWADPEKQPKPHAWADLEFPELLAAVADHTRAVLLALKAEGISPEFVGIGNENTHGMLWPDGRVGSSIPSGNPTTDANAARFAGEGNYDQFAALLKSGIAASREVSPSSRIVLHNHLGRHHLRVREWMDSLLARGVEFDVLGLSCYAQGKEGDWLRTFVDVSLRYPNHPFMVVEYSARKRYINDLTFGAPANHGLGTFIWEPTRHREAVFDRDGRNAGGGQAANFVQDFGINQGGSLPPAAAAQQASAAAGQVAPPPPRRAPSRRYETNEYMKLYPEMVRDYRIASPTPAPAQ